MNNEDTQYMANNNVKPEANNNAQPNVNGTNPQPTNKKNDNSGAKVAAAAGAGVVGGAAAGVGGMFAKEKWDEKHAAKESAAKKNDEPKDEPKADRHDTEDVKHGANENGRHETAQNQQHETEPTRHTDNNLHTEHHTTPGHTVKPEVVPVHNDDDIDIQVISTEEVVTEDGAMNVTMAKVDGHEAVLVDVNQNGQNELAAIDWNDNGRVDHGEVIDLTSGEVIDVNQIHSVANNTPRLVPEPEPAVISPEDDPSLIISPNPEDDPYMCGLPETDPQDITVSPEQNTLAMDDYDPTTGMGDYQSDADVNGLV